MELLCINGENKLKIQSRSLWKFLVKVNEELLCISVLNQNVNLAHESVEIYCTS
jgi:hypothetical protein